MVRACLVSLVLLASCSLPSGVRYACEADGGCAQAAHLCLEDGYCHPAEQLEDGGLVRPDAGPCVPRDVSQACDIAECGFINDGCRDVSCNKRCAGPMECGVKTPNVCGFPSLCTSSGWCWEHPLPQGHTLTASWRFDERHTWFVGENRVVLFHDGERSWLPELPAGLPRDSYLEAVHGSSPSDVYAVGQGALILHFNGTAWERELVTGTTATPHLRTVTALADGGAWAGGFNGAVLRRVAAAPPETRWRVESPVPFGSDEVRRIFFDDQDQLYVITRRRELWVKKAGWERFDQVALMNEASTATMWDGGILVAGAGSTQGTGIMYLPGALPPDAGGAWVSLDAGINAIDLKVGEGGLLVVGLNGLLAWLDDTGQLRLSLNLPNNVTAVPTGYQTAFIGGFNGYLADVNLRLNINGGAVQLRSSPNFRPTLHFNNICSSRGETLFAVGGNDNGPGSALRWMQRFQTSLGTEWRVAPDRALSGSAGQLLGCFVEDGRAFLLSDDGKFFELSGLNWTPSNGDFTAADGGNYWGHYRSAWGLPGGYYFTKINSSHEFEVTYSATGQTGTFEQSSTGNMQRLEAVWGLSADDVMAVGRDTNRVRFDGTTFTTDNLSSFDDFLSVHGAVLADGRRRYVAGTDDGTAGVFERPSGGGPYVDTIEPVVAGEGATEYRAAFVSRTGLSWVAGRSTFDGGTVVRKRFDTGGWVDDMHPGPLALTGLTGHDWDDGGVSLWVTGFRGTIMRKDVP